MVHSDNTWSKHFGQWDYIQSHPLHCTHTYANSSQIAWVKVYHSWALRKATLRFASHQEVKFVYVSSLAQIGSEREVKDHHWNICLCVTGPWSSSQIHTRTQHENRLCIRCEHGIRVRAFFRMRDIWSIVCCRLQGGKKPWLSQICVFRQAYLSSIGSVKEGAQKNSLGFRAFLPGVK